MTSWIFQANPKRYDLLAEWVDNRVVSWAANQHREKMNIGDVVFFRLSGKSAGLYATGTVTSTCYEEPNEFGVWKVDVRYDRLIFPPILRAETEAIAAANNYRPLIGQEATNFLVPDGVAAAVMKLITTRRDPGKLSLGRLTSREAVLKAIEEYDQLGRDEFLKNHGFGEARSYVLVYEEREYDSKAIAGVACKYQFGSSLSAAEFSGGQATVQKKLQALGFVVRGSRPPTWVRDELILALDLYIRRGWLDDLHPEVQDLSAVLNGLPLHPEWRFSAKFRNPNGVCMKLANFQALDPRYKGTGLADVSAGDQAVWDEFHHRPDELAHLARSIREGSKADEAEHPEDGEDEADEGRILTRIHRARERNQKLVVKRKLERRKETGGALTCEVCDFDFSAFYGDRGDGFAECHHKIPLAESGSTKTRVQDLAVLCANCHRMIHVRKPTLSVEELKRIIGAEA